LKENNSTDPNEQIAIEITTGGFRRGLNVSIEQNPCKSKMLAGSAPNENENTLVMSSDETYRDNLRGELERAIRTPWFREGKVVSALAKISRHRDADMIKDIIPLLWAKEEVVFFETVATVYLLLQQVRIEELPRFDYRLRKDWPYWLGDSMLSAVNIKRLQSSSARWTIFAVFASHPSGFVRQTALEELARDEEGESLPFILLRTLDWVEPVRIIAQDIFLQKMDRVAPDQVDRCLPLVFRMRRRLGYQRLRLFHEVEKFAASRDDGSIADHYPDSSSAFLRYRFKLSKQYSGFSLDRLIGEAVLHSNAAPRLLACDWVADAATPKEIREKFGNVLLTDKSQFVRSKAFWLIAHADPSKFLPLIERALMDPNASVQGAARSAWRMLHERETVSLYRRYVDEARFPSAIIAALRGLRAEGDLHDEATVRAFLQHNSAKVRKEALRTLTTWNVTDTSNLLHEGLRSASPSYAKEAARLLINRREYISVPLVQELLVNPHNLDSRKVALWLLRKMPKWSSLPLILLSYTISSCRDQALTAFMNWNKNYNNSQSLPSKAEANAAVKAFGAIAGSPLSKNRELAAIISNLESMK
jgi:hypothetical protein